MTDWREMVESLTLPNFLQWGGWSGDYRVILCGDREVSRFGGVIAKTSPDTEQLQASLDRQLFKSVYAALGWMV